MVGARNDGLVQRGGRFARLFALWGLGGGQAVRCGREQAVSNDGWSRSHFVRSGCLLAAVSAPRCQTGPSAALQQLNGGGAGAVVLRPTRRPSDFCFELRQARTQIAHNGDTATLTATLGMARLPDSGSRIAMQRGWRHTAPGRRGGGRASCAARPAGHCAVGVPGVIGCGRHGCVLRIHRISPRCAHKRGGSRRLAHPPGVFGQASPYTPETRRRPYRAALAGDLVPLFILGARCLGLQLSLSPPSLRPSVIHL